MIKVCLPMYDYFRTPPIICGYNTGQHMWVPASDNCNKINIDIDTASTGTTRSWNIKVSQHECNNLATPDADCLQWLTAESGISFSLKFKINYICCSGTIATFNWNTGASQVETLQTHLSDQYYDICIRYILQIEFCKKLNFICR